MKKTVILAAVLALAAGLSVRASDAVEPATLVITNFRGEAIVNVSEISYYNGTSLQFSNCVLFAGASTNAARQGLEDVTVEIKIGNLSTNDTYTADSVGTNGEWNCLVTVPEFTGYTYLQIKVTDVNTNTYIYPWKILNRKDPL